MIDISKIKIGDKVSIIGTLDWIYVSDKGVSVGVKVPNASVTPRLHDTVEMRIDDVNCWEASTRETKKE